MTTDGRRGPQGDFIDGVMFDATKPNAYLQQSAIGLKGNDLVKAKG
jgi:nitrate/nitrite transport system substrate-binding protein